MVSVVAACYLLGGVVLVMFLGSCCCASCVWCMQQVAALAFLLICPAIVSWCLCTASVSSCLCTESVSSVCIVGIQYKFTGWCAKKSNFGFIDPDVLGKLNQVCFQPTLIFLFFINILFYKFYPFELRMLPALLPPMLYIVGELWIMLM